MVPKEGVYIAFYGRKWKRCVDAGNSIPQVNYTVEVEMPSTRSSTTIEI